jgi:hypothetical protein
MRERTAVVWHLMKKDWSYVRGWAALCAVVTLTSWVWILGDADLQFAAFAHYAAVMLLPPVALVRLIQVDPAMGSTAFALTRPIDRVLALIAKALTGALALALPTVLLGVAPLVVRGLDLRPQDYGLALASASLRFALFAAGAIAAAAFTRTLAQATVAAVAAIVSAGIGMTAYRRVWPLGGLFETASFGVVLPMVLLAMALAVAYAVYRTRRLRIAAITVAAMVALLVTLHRTWDWPLPRSFQTTMFRPSRNLPSRWPVQVAVPPESIGWYAMPGERIARASIQVKGLPAGLSLVQSGYDVRTDTAGSYARDFLHVFLRERDVLSLSEPGGIPSLWQAAFQCPADLAERQAGAGVSGRVDVFRQAAHDGRPLPGRLDGVLRFVVVRPRVVQRVAIRDAAAELKIPTGRIAAHHAAMDDVSTGLVLRTEHLNVIPFPTRGIGTRFLIALFDPATGDCIAPITRGKTVAAVSLPLVAIDWSVTDWRRVGRRGPSEVGPLPEDLQLAVVENEVVGTFETRFEVALPAASPVL